MTIFNTIHTDVWMMSLPPDWKQREAGDGKSLYFEAADGAKGVYVTTWSLGADDRRSAEEVAAAFKQADLRSLANMAGYAWQTMSEVTRGAGNACVAMTDCLAAEKHYRSVSKILVAPPLVVRASFQDYACDDYEASLRFFAPMIDSMQFYAGAA